MGIGVAVDVAVLALDGERLSVLLVKLKRAPFEGRWGLPGGRIGARETAPWWPEPKPYPFSAARAQTEEVVA